MLNALGTSRGGQAADQAGRAYSSSESANGAGLDALGMDLTGSVSAC